MTYALLIAFFFLEYVRPTSYVPALLALHLNSIVPLAAFLGSVSGATPATVDRLKKEPNTKMILGLYGLVWLSVVTADVQQLAWDAQIILLGYVLAYWVIASELTTVARVKGVIGVMILVHLVVAALNPSLLTDPGGRHYITSGGFLGDGNDFALSLDVIVPLCLFMLLGSKGITPRLLWGTALLVLIAGVVGTQSRGGTVGLAATALYYMSQSTRKWQTAAVAVVAVVLILALAPGSYFDRISTIGDTQEGSAQGRITAWKVAIQMALDNPILGVGAAHFGTKLGYEYRPPGFVGSGMTAHSIYFLSLGELGVPGLVLLISLIVWNLRANGRLIRELKSTSLGSRQIDLQLLSAMSAAMIAFASAGAFLSALYYPHLYVICGISTAVRAVVRERVIVGAVPVAAAKPELVLHWALRRQKPAWHSRQADRRR